MHAIDVLKLLLTYQSMIQSELDAVIFSRENTMISSSYSFVTLDVSANEGDLLCRVRFELDERGAELDEVYCKDKSLTATLRSKLESKKFPGFDDAVGAAAWPDDVRSSIEQADKLAALCLNCVAGDNYRPGNFSKISLHHDRIELDQINKMNSKSLDHKNNYSLRSLEFVIPLSKDSTPSIAQYKIGKMLVEFTDHSSPNNRRYGDEVVNELERLSEN